MGNNGQAGCVHSVTVLGMPNVRRLKERGRNSMSDQQALILLNEFAKVDPKALKLMALLQDAKDFGEQDMLLNQIHNYIKEHTNG